MRRRGEARVLQPPTNALKKDAQLRHRGLMDSPSMPLRVENMRGSLEEKNLPGDLITHHHGTPKMMTHTRERAPNVHMSRVFWRKAPLPLPETPIAFFPPIKQKKNQTVDKGKIINQSCVADPCRSRGISILS
jgi:hypothetical protein